MRKYGGRLPSVQELSAYKDKDVEDKFSSEDFTKLNSLYAEYQRILTAGQQAQAWDADLNNAENRAAAFVGRKQEHLLLASTVISVAYIISFLIGSALSILAAAFKAASESP